MRTATYIIALAMLVAAFAVGWQVGIAELNSRVE
jgi:hypothetical protein